MVLSVAAMSRAFWRRATPYLAPLAVSTALASLAIGRILAAAGRPALPLDDSFIHLQYAKRFAEGHPFTFAPGDGFSTGATSFLWPLMLAPLQLFGLHGLSAIWGPWILGTLLHAATALETKRLVEPITGKGAAYGAGAMCLLFGAFTWFAWSGMETIGLAWAMTRTARVAADWWETQPFERTPRRALGLALVGAACPLFRPEGSLFALAAFAVLVIRPPQIESERLRAAKQRTFALVPVAFVLLQPLVNYLATGHARSTTTMVKWAIGNPYFTASTLAAFVGHNVRVLLADLLGGGADTAIFLPKHANYVIGAGLIAWLPSVIRSKRPVRGALGLLLALGTLIPCTFLTIVWNRVRYIYPFAPGWFFLVACLASELEALAVRWKKELGFVGALVTGIAALALATKLNVSMKDLANSAHAVDRQQVRLGEWARDNLPEAARIGVNDTGAIAFMSGRKTFDVVGLTTEGEARYWIAGPGSRYEHYERMPTDLLPTHFIVYPEWMACPPVLGERLTEATVNDQSILGGVTKVAYMAKYDVLGRGALPSSRVVGSRVLDELDVSDLESEARHRYVLGDANAERNVVTSEWNRDGLEIADGGRHERAFDRFVVDLPMGRPVRMIARLAAPAAVPVQVFVDGTDITTITVPESAWHEVEVVLPPAVTGPGKLIELRGLGARFGSLHYWFFEE